MTTVTLTIPQTALVVGSHVAGPVTNATSLSAAQLSLTRTVPGGLNSLTVASSIHYDFQFSLDGGTTWGDIASGDIFGGAIPKEATATVVGFGVEVNGQPLPAGAQVRANVTVAGPSPITVAGSLSVTS